MNALDDFVEKAGQLMKTARKASEAEKHRQHPTHLELSRNAAVKILPKSPRLFLCCCAIVRLLRSCKDFLTSPNFVLLVVVPPTWSLDDIERCAKACLYNDGRKPDFLAIFSHPKLRDRKRRWDFNPEEVLASTKVLVFAHSGTQLHPEIEAAADMIVSLEPVSDRHLDALTTVLDTGVINDVDKEFLRKNPSTFIDAAFRKGRSASPVIERLRHLTKKSEASAKILPMQAFGEAHSWAEHLRQDLMSWRAGTLAWKEIDKGVLVYGPPGTGKSTFAASLAQYLEVPLIATSLAKWQSAGHLGDLLKSMHSDFALARSEAPSVLLVDELDSIGDRAQFVGENAHYCSEVVNGLLELVDGCLQREGVIVIGASNFHQKIDPALLRPGRLEKHLELAKPNVDTRASILQYYLPDLDQEALGTAATLLRGATGADIEYLARRAKQRARIDGRQVSSEDLLQQLPTPPALSGDEVWRICIHEAGHAILAKLFSVGKIVEVEAAPADLAIIDGTDNLSGRMVVTKPLRIIQSETSLRDDIAMQLGGLVAEEIHFGDKSTSAGGSSGSDLAKTSEIARQMIASFGMGRSLCVFPGTTFDPLERHLPEHSTEIHREINFILRTEYERSKDALKAHWHVVLDLALALQKEHRVSGERLERLLEPVGPARALTS